MTKLTTIILFCALALSGCESMSAAWDKAKNTFSPTNPPTNPGRPAIPNVAASNEELTPVRSDAPLSSVDIADQPYADEATNHGTPPVSALIPVNFRQPTPTTLAGGKLISTYQLHQALTSKKPPIVINALSGEVTELIPGSVWLSGAGAKGKFNDDTQKQLEQRLQELTDGDSKKMLVFYCTGYNCWRSYNAALRAVNARYRNVHWYRGGLTAWYAAGLPTLQSHDDHW